MASRFFPQTQTDSAVGMKACVGLCQTTNRSDFRTQRLSKKASIVYASTLNHCPSDTIIFIYRYGLGFFLQDFIRSEVTLETRKPPNNITFVKSFPSSELSKLMNRHCESQHKLYQKLESYEVGQLFKNLLNMHNDFSLCFRYI